MMSKKLITVLFFLCLSLLAQGQRYKDIFPQIISSGDDKTMELLTNYLFNNLDHPNTNLRLGLLYAKKYQTTDPLREYDKAMALAEQARTRLIKASILINEKEFNKNKDYYIGIIQEGVIPTLAETQKLIADELQKAETFLEKLPPIYEHFTRSVDRYDRAVKSFAAIAGKYGSLKELYLLYDDSLAKVMQQLKTNYDSTKWYFDKYLQLRQGYPIKAVLQTYREKPVVVYRLDGLVTQINFLQPQIVLWDYASWVDTVNQVVATEIKDLRQSLQENYDKLKTASEQAATLKDPQGFTPVALDKKLRFNLMRFDYHNALVPMLAFLEYSQQLSLARLREVYFDTADIAMERKLVYYNEMLYLTRRGDSLLAEFNRRYNARQLQRHAAFIARNFGSPAALRQWMNEQRQANRQVFLAEAGKIRTGIAAIAPPGVPGKEVRYRKLIIPLSAEEEIPATDVSRVRVAAVVKGADDYLYVAGNLPPAGPKKQQKAVLVRISPALRVAWAKYIDIQLDSTGVSDAHQAVGGLQLTNEGVALAVYSMALDSSRAAVTLLHYTSAGKLKFGTRLDTDLYPQALRYDEGHNMFFVGLLGQGPADSRTAAADLQVIAVNGLGSELWQYENRVQGDLLTLFTTHNGVMLGGNYSSIIDRSGRTVAAGKGTYGYMIKLDFAGKPQKIVLLPSQQPYEVKRIFKVADNNISLLGANDEHIILNNDLKVVYTSLILN